MFFSLSLSLSLKLSKVWVLRQIFHERKIFLSSRKGCLCSTSRNEEWIKISNLEEVSSLPFLNSLPPNFQWETLSLSLFLNSFYPSYCQIFLFGWGNVFSFVLSMFMLLFCNDTICFRFLPFHNRLCQSEVVTDWEMEEVLQGKGK